MLKKPLGVVRIGVYIKINSSKMIIITLNLKKNMLNKFTILALVAYTVAA